MFTHTSAYAKVLLFHKLDLGLKVLTFEQHNDYKLKDKSIILGYFWTLSFQKLDQTCPTRAVWPTET